MYLCILLYIHKYPQYTSSISADLADLVHIIARLVLLNKARPVEMMVVAPTVLYGHSSGDVSIYHVDRFIYIYIYIYIYMYIYI